MSLLSFMTHLGTLAAMVSRYAEEAPLLAMHLLNSLGASVTLQRPADTVEEAAHTYDAAAMAYAGGPNTDLNFPPTTEQISACGTPVSVL